MMKGAQKMSYLDLLLLMRHHCSHSQNQPVLDGLGLQYALYYSEIYETFPNQLKNGKYSSEAEDGRPMQLGG